MSGGHFNGQGYCIKIKTNNISKDEDFSFDAPKLAELIEVIGSVLYQVIREYDLHISGDSHIKNMEKYQNDSIEKIGLSVVKFLNRRGDSA